MAFAPPFQRPFSATFDRRAAVAAAPWWLAGGVAAANAVAVYKPIGSASLAASYDNIAAPGNGLADGTYDAAPGTAPSFDAATGWTFAAASTQYLTTGVVPKLNQSFSMIARFSDIANGGILCGMTSQAGNGFLLWPVQTTNHRYYNGSFRSIAGAVTAGVMAVVGASGYLNGIEKTTTIPGGIDNATVDIYIGAYNLNNLNSPASPIDAKVQAFAIYNTTLTAGQVLAISTAMAAL